MINITDFTLTNEWEVLSGVAGDLGDDGFATLINAIKATHDVKFLHLERTEFGYIRYIIAKKAR
jgi:hypothetical protein